MNLSLWLNSFGLILDIIGVLILFKYGLPPNALSVGDDGILTNKLAPRAMMMRRTALGLIVTGFILQGVAGWLISCE